MRPISRPATRAIATDLSGFSETYLHVPSTSLFCAAIRLSPCSPSQSAVGAATPAALSTAWWASSAARSMIGIALRAASSAAPTALSTAACALDAALFRGPSPPFGEVPEAEGKEVLAVVSKVNSPMGKLKTANKKPHVHGLAWQ